MNDKDNKDAISFEASLIHIFDTRGYTQGSPELIYPAPTSAPGPISAAPKLSEASSLTKTGDEAPAQKL